MLVPDLQPLKLSIFQVFHDVPIAGQGGIHKTYKAKAAVFFWKNMRKEIIDLVKSCAVCQKVKYSTEKKSGLLQPLPIPDRHGLISPWILLLAYQVLMGAWPFWLSWTALRSMGILVP